MLLAAVASLSAIPRADAFCGFYVAGSDQQMFNDATQVVLMRDGTRTVLSMQNTYQGPPQDFALVIPVPVVLHEGDVKTLGKDVFAHVEQMGAPRLVEYWERDPCAPPEPPKHRMASAGMAMPVMAHVSDKPGDMGVTIEAKFTVGEYQILILSAKDSTGLDAWLHLQNYKIPDGAEPLLRPYVESGMKFFVAKVDPAKVKFVDGRAALSPLRFYYDSDDFSLPIRLGLANSSGTQDLIVNIFSPHQRYEVGNYKNVTIPTNIDVADAVKTKFGAFYAALFDRTIEKNPGAVVTEYAWQATGCDPCPGPTLQPDELATLGGDVLGGTKDKPAPLDNFYDMVLDAAPRALRQGHQQRSRVQAGVADRRRSRVRAERGQARGGRARGFDQQLPGALRDPPRVDRADHLRASGAPHLGRPSARGHADAGLSGDRRAARDRPRVRAAQHDRAARGRQARRARDRSARQPRRGHRATAGAGRQRRRRAHASTGDDAGRDQDRLRLRDGG